MFNSNLNGATAGAYKIRRNLILNKQINIYFYLYSIKILNKKKNQIYNAWKKIFLGKKA